MADKMSKVILPVKNGDVITNKEFDIRDADIAAFIGYTDDDIYGVEVDLQNKTFTRLSGAVGKNAGSDFDSINTFGGRRRCNLTDDGVVTAYYGDEAYTETGLLKQAVTKDGVTYPVGTEVQVMVEQPRFYYKVVPLKLEKLPDGNGYQIRKARYYVSDTPKEGFKLHPAFIRNNEEADYIYFSAYEGCTYDVSASAYNMNDAQTVDFTTSTGDKLASIANAKPTSGLSQTGATRAGFRKIAHNRGDDWEQAYAATISCTQLLMLIEYASFNMQNEIAKGVCDISDNSSYNCSSLTGSTSSLGNASGRAASTINTKGSTSTTETVDGKTSMTYRGEENPYSNIWIFIDGTNIKNPSTFTSGYTEHLYIADHDFADDTATGYEDTGIHPCYGEGYISAFGYSEDYDWLFIPTELLGNSTIPIGDYDWNRNSGWRVAILGGCWYHGLKAGAFYWYLYDASSDRTRGLGGRLVYFKKKQAA